MGGGSITQRWGSALAELLRFSPLLLNLAWRDIRVRYTQSLLGIAWAILLPLSMMLVFTFVFTRAIGTSVALDVEMPYPLFAYAGLVPWTFFSVSLNNCINSLVANRNLVTKVYFPREVLPLSCVAGSLVDFCIAGTVLLGLAAYFRWTGQYTARATWAVALVPFLVLVQMALTAGLGMALAALHLFFRDVRPVFAVVIQLWMFLSAVVVPVPGGGSLFAAAIAWNPMVPLITSYRDCLLKGKWPEATGLAYAAFVSLAVLLAGWAGFRRASVRFAEQI